MGNVKYNYRLTALRHEKTGTGDDFTVGVIYVHDPRLPLLASIRRNGQRNVDLQLYETLSRRGIVW